MNLWVCSDCGVEFSGPFRGRCDRVIYGGKKCHGVTRALPRPTDSVLMAELRKRSPEHTYNNDNEIIDSWLNIAKLGMQLSTWELKFLAHLFEAIREELGSLKAARAQPGVFQVGATQDGKEVAINCPYTPDNGTGWIHYACTPDQARNMAQVLLKKADEADAIRGKT